MHMVDGYDRIGGNTRLLQPLDATHYDYWGSAPFADQLHINKTWLGVFGSFPEKGSLRLSDQLLLNTPGQERRGGETSAIVEAIEHDLEEVVASKEQALENPILPALTKRMIERFNDVFPRYHALAGIIVHEEVETPELTAVYFCAKLLRDVISPERSRLVDQLFRNFSGKSFEEAPVERALAELARLDEEADLDIGLQLGALVLPTEIGGPIEFNDSL